MDFSKEMIEASEAADFAYAKWYEKLPDERKAQMFLSGFNFAAQKIKADVLKENPFATESDIKMRFIELTQKEDYSADTFLMIERTMQKRSDKEWKARFSKMKNTMKWSYEDIAHFIGAANGASVKASLNRQVPAFAKLAVCLFEKMSSEESMKQTP